MAALARFPGVPAIYVCHGWLPWEETPPRHPRLRRYVTVSDFLCERLQDERGLIREGFHADLSVFDPARIADLATYDEPHRYAAGVVLVIVNGTVVIDAGEHTGALPGQVLRRGPRGVA